MSWTFMRIAAAVLAVIAGGLAGHGLGAAFDAPLAATLLGAALAVAALAVFDLLRARRLIAWLRGEQVDAAPRARGLWFRLRR